MDIADEMMVAIDKHKAALDAYQIAREELIEARRKKDEIMRRYYDKLRQSLGKKEGDK